MGKSIEELKALAVETMFEEITVYGSEDAREVRGSAFTKFSDEDDREWERNDFPDMDPLFAGAVEQAILFYADEAGGNLLDPEDVEALLRAGTDEAFHWLPEFLSLGRVRQLADR